ncbi:bacteriohemerythrin [Sulfurimonas autotrophica]|uniref:diguanylate cyclase n=1 Tax=Sulfurimonas autotrophica (strain ATCC BAA-671 / DSM 16294 / JCM 11897 / OK10) TaxID=563040 RepID=E0URV6_SULAO|nr:bacteriohemerythrin [Sulfurimonas autotrophica]ADN10120.1 diguanylate cyclase with hemerythrin-like metal-binding domain protein [Sulfurimonas autotrophica DSM 16294]
MIEWNEGLNLGIKDLDDDHKQLLNIINELLDAINKDMAANIIAEKFTQLQSYTQSHYRREEEYLRKCGCIKLKEYKAKQHIFNNKIVNLKKKLASLQNYEIFQEISLFLTEWLVSHIIEDNISAINALGECDLNQKKEEADTSFFARLSKKTTDKFSFTKRIFFSVLIPFMGMLLFGSIVIFANFNKYLDMKKIYTITSVIPYTNDLIHNLQIERGLSSGSLSSREGKFKDALQKERKIVDKKLIAFINKINTSSTFSAIPIEPYIKIFSKNRVLLANVRKKIDNRTVSKKKAISIYTNIIKDMLEITPKLASLKITKELSSSIITLSALQNFKESLGLERAYGTIILENKNASAEEYIAFMQLLSRRDTFLYMFNNTATKAQKTTVNSIMSSIKIKKINKDEKDIRNYHFGNLDSKNWFKLTTEFINRVKLFEDKCTSDINTYVETQIDDTVINFIIWIIFNTFILFITLFILYTFRSSTKLQIEQLTKAMKNLARGGRSLRLSPIKLHRDEMAYIYDAYEITRQNLLKGDIYTQMYLNQKEIELKNKQKENLQLEEMAFIDPLTGAVNRRKGEELFALELERATRYKRDLSFLMLDIDHFKQVNDTYGHAVGDEVLKHFSSICLKMARHLDVVARIGGEEFAVMLPETNSEGAYEFAERFREKICNSSVIIDNTTTIKYSVSIGISSLDITYDKDVKTILERADKALYQAKKSGRNTTNIYIT